MATERLKKIHLIGVLYFPNKIGEKMNLNQKLFLYETSGNVSFERFIECPNPDSVTNN